MVLLLIWSARLAAAGRAQVLALDNYQGVHNSVRLAIAEEPHETSDSLQLYFYY